MTTLNKTLTRTQTDLLERALKAYGFQCVVANSDLQKQIWKINASSLKPADYDIVAMVLEYMGTCHKHHEVRAECMEMLRIVRFYL